MSTDRDKSSAEIEREVESTRAGLTATLDELKDRLSPGRLIDQAVDFSKDSGGREFMDSLGNAVRANPIPVLLIGAGIAWLLTAGGGSTAAFPRSKTLNGMNRRRGGERWPHQHDWGDEDTADASAAVGVASRAATAIGSAAANLAGQAAAAVGQAASSAYDTVAGAAGQAASTVGQAAYSAGRSAGDTAYAYGRSAGSEAVAYGRSAAEGAIDRVEDAWHYGQRNIGGIIEQQPLVAGAIGLAIGAALGAAIPSTEAEHRLMGERADELKKRARELATEQYANVKETAGQLYEDIREEAATLSAVPGEIAGQVAERVVAAATSAGSAAKESVGEALGVTGANTKAPMGGPKPASPSVGKTGTAKAG